MNLKFLLALLLVLALFESSSAQEQCQLKLYGRITDEHDGSDLAYSNLLIKGPNQFVKGLASDEQGRYEVAGLCPGDYQVIVSHIGCEPDTVQLELRGTQKLNLELEHHLEELQEVEVSSERKSSLEKKEQLSDEQRTEQAGESLAEILEQLPGVNAFKTGANVSKPMIGGFTSNRIQVINDGVQLSNQNWGDEHAPEIDPFANTKLSVIKGASAVKYGGGALGGFVLVEPKPLPRTPGIEGKFNALYATNNRMYASALSLAGNSSWLPKLSWRAEGSFRRAGNLRAPDYYQNNTGIDDQNFGWQLAWFENNWKVNLNYSLYRSKLGIFSGAHIGNLSDLEAAIAQEQPRAVDRQGFSYEIDRPYQLITHELLKAEFSRYFQNAQLDISISRQFNIREEFDKESPRNQDLAALNIPEFSLGLESYNLNSNYSHKNGAWSWELGGGMLFKENSVNSFIDFIPDYKGLYANLFGMTQFEQGKWTYEAALRYDKQLLEVNKLIDREFRKFDHDFDAFTSSLGLIRELNARQLLSINLSFAERAPAINELYSEGLHHGTASLEYGDSEIDKEQAFSLRSNWEFNQQIWGGNLHAYLQYIDDFIYLKPDGVDLTIRGAFPVFLWQNTTALLRGFDLDLYLRLSTALRIEQKSSFLWADQLGSEKGEDYLVNMPANRLRHKLIFQTSSLDLKEQSWAQGWTFSLGHEYVFRQQRFDEEVEIAPPPAAYQLWSFSASRQLSLFKGTEASLGLIINNFTNESYRDYLNRFRFYAD